MLSEVPFVTWLRALNAVGTVAEAARFFRGSGQPTDPAPVPSEGTGGSLETRLANVVVAALREAFDRDRARFDLERELHSAAEARRAQELRLEWLRQSTTQALTHARHLAMLSVVVWIASVIAAGWLSPIGTPAKVLLGAGWGGLSAAMAAAFMTHQRLAVWLALGALSGVPAPGSVSETTSSSSTAVEFPEFRAQTLLPWLFLGGFLMTASGLVVGL